MKRAAALVLAVAIAASAVVGCGSGSKSKSTGTSTASSTPEGPPAGLAAVVGKHQITVAMFQHWLRVIVSSHTTSGGQQAIIPDPPNYTNCIAAAKASGKVNGSSTERLHNDCAQLYRVDTDQVMDFLIKSFWLLDAGAAAHALPTQAEVTANFNAEKAHQFKTPAAFDAFLKSTGQTEADLLLRIKTGRIEQLLAKKAGGDKQLLDGLTKQYVPQTHCATAYVNPDCSEYKP
jgi:foldase protein PrsA